MISQPSGISRGRRGLWGLAALLTLFPIACSRTIDVTQTTVAATTIEDDSPGFTARCQQPPAEELAAKSIVRLELDPNPVVAGQSATLSISDVGLAEGTTVGNGSDWKCWDGSDWLTTHRMWGPGNTDVVRPGVTTTNTPIAFELPRSVVVQIPDVEPGTYRISHFGFVFVEVVAP